ncbi:MAG: four helix bundle protein [Candidatus Symbiothrix sp.]|jgi:hypothetical protein|nr:four helix bundle protein [Candidatus Symbiothrix sp.]
MALYYDLPIYKETYRLMKILGQLMPHLPREVKYTLGAEMRGEVKEMIRCIFRANTTHDKEPWLIKMAEHVEFLRFELQLGFDDKVISEKQLKFITNIMDSIGRQLTGWRNSLSKKNC